VPKRARRARSTVVGRSDPPLLGQPSEHEHRSERLGDHAGLVVAGDEVDESICGRDSVLYREIQFTDGRRTPLGRLSQRLWRHEHI
jgi:hypothetical protein